MDTETSAAESLAPLTQAQRLLFTFTAPSKTFLDIRRSASFWLPLLLATLATLIFAVILQAQLAVLINPHVSPQAQAAIQAHRIPDPRVHLSRTFYFEVYEGIVAEPFIVFGVKAFLFWIACLSLRSRANYRQIYAVIAYSALPGVAATCIFQAGELAFHRNLLWGTNLTDYFPHAPLLAADLMRSVGLFGLWAIVLQVIGLAIVGQISRRQAIGAVVVWELLEIVFSMSQHWLGLSIK